MSRQKYTHVQALLPEIRAMVAAGKLKEKSQSISVYEISMSSKSCLSVNVEKKRKSKLVLCHVPKVVLAKHHLQEM